MDSPINLVQPRVRDYLFSFKNSNAESYRCRYGTKKLSELTYDEVIEFFILASAQDVNKLSILSESIN